MYIPRWWTDLHGPQSLYGIQSHAPLESGGGPPDIWLSPSASLLLLHKRKRERERERERGGELILWRREHCCCSCCILTIDGAGEPLFSLHPHLHQVKKWRVYDNMRSSKDLRVLADVLVVDGSPFLPKRPTHWMAFARAVVYEIKFYDRPGEWWGGGGGD